MQGRSPITNKRNDKGKDKDKVNEDTNPNSLQSPHIKRQSNLNFKLLEQYAVSAFEKIESAKGEDIVLVIGNMGAGKSTTVGYLAGYEIQKVESEFTPEPLAIPTGERAPEVGPAIRGMTLFSEIFKEKGVEGKGLAYCDCPGFLDNRGAEERICASISIQAAIKSARSIRAIIVVIQYSSLNERRGQVFRELVDTLAKLLKNPEMTKSILFVFTQKPEAHSAERLKQMAIKKISLFLDAATTDLKEWTKKNLEVDLGNHFESMKNLLMNNQPELEEGEEHELEELKKQLTILSLIQSNTQNVFVLDVFDKGEHRAEIAAHIKTLEPIPVNQFYFSEYDDIRLAFNEYVSTITRRGAKVIREKVDLPINIDRWDQQIKDFQTRIEFYHNEKMRLEVGKVDIGEEYQNRIINLVRERAIKDKERLDELGEDLALVNSEIQNLEIEKSELSTSELVEYWSDSFHSKYTWWWDGIGSVRKKFEYLGNPCLPFEKVEKTKTRGQFFDEVSEKYIMDKATGKVSSGRYSVEYKSSFAFEDANARVKIFLQNKNMPDNIKRIEDIEEELKNKRYESLELGVQIDALKKHTEELENVLQEEVKDIEAQVKREIEEYELGIRNYKENVSSFEQKIKQTKEELQKIEEEFNQHQLMYKVIFQIAQCIDFNSRLVDEFLLQYTRWLSQRITEIPIEQPNLFKDPPKEFICPISQDIMTDPVSTRCGHKFDRKEIITALKNNKECPIDREPVQRGDLYRDHDLRSRIEDWLKRQDLKMKRGGSASLRYSAAFARIMNSAATTRATRIAYLRGIFEEIVRQIRCEWPYIVARGNKVSIIFNLEAEAEKDLTGLTGALAHTFELEPQNIKWMIDKESLEQRIEINSPSFEIAQRINSLLNESLGVGSSSTSTSLDEEAGFEEERKDEKKQEATKFISTYTKLINSDLKKKEADLNEKEVQNSADEILQKTGSSQNYLNDIRNREWKLKPTREVIRENFKREDEEEDRTSFADHLKNALDKRRPFIDGGNDSDPSTNNKEWEDEEKGPDPSLGI